MLLSIICVAGCTLQEETDTEEFRLPEKKYLTIANEYQVSAGVKSEAGSHYIIEEGILKGYGNNQFGQLGTGEIEDTGIYHELPVNIAKDVIHVDMLTPEFVIFLNDKNELYGIGNNRSGQLGQSIEGKDRMSTDCFVTEPVLIADNVKYAAAGLNFILILKLDGSLYSLGDNANGQLGDGTAKPVCGERYSAYSTPFSDIPIFIRNNISYIACDLYTAAAIQNDGTLFTWGDNSFGEIGNGKKGNEMPTVSTNVVAEPFPVMNGIQSIRFEDFTTYATDYSGQQFAWGKNYMLNPQMIEN